MNVKELLSLKNKIIIVTGGAGLYGKTIVEGLAEADGTVITDDSTLDTERKNGQQNSIYLNQNNAVDQVEDDNASDFYSDYSIGARYGLNTETANVNPTFRIDKKAGVINFFKK